MPLTRVVPASRRVAWYLLSLCARQAPVPQMSACARGIAFARPSAACCLARNAGSRRHDHPPPDDDEGGQNEQQGVNRHLSPRILVSGYLMWQSPTSAFRCLSDSGRKVPPEVARGCGRIRAVRAARGAAGVVGYTIGFVVVGGISGQSNLKLPRLLYSPICFRLLRDRSVCYAGPSD